MEPYLIASLGAALVSLAFWHWLYCYVMEPDMSGDKWYMRRFAFTDEPVSAPYCWRPLLPWLARVFGFRAVTYAAMLTSVAVIYSWSGGGQVGFAVALAFIGNRHMWNFHVKNPEYSDGLGILLTASFLAALASGHPWLAALVGVAGGLTRESVGLSLAVAGGVAYHPLLALPPAAAVAAAYFLRRENLVNRHPCTEPGFYATVKRWAGEKKERFLHYSHTIQSLRGIAFAVPFVWDRVGDQARLGLWGLLPILGLALPASGQSRIFAYAWVFLVPFLAACSEAWLWLLVLLQWSWPVEYYVYDETGGQNFGYAK